ncbi:NADPH-dependent F420 reductase [Nocardioides daeguensis]|uniref:NADPH-dependent F420 reductase n=1 Tax=Nocardioides daeguensis TaxID=908359 RepID=A0ABP6V788_9ACTN|nr:NADPH-dependent F420 reductase [Nocardioides daeguensis]MBV6726484.1 NADPH-dependent F420 reductase [Nocardioides daeguensis]MCR1772327.1 NADPH-dependent F420 reductase [Nocardioides daeguensis]
MTTVAILGGAGPQGRGLARRFAAAGVEVILGSRTAERALAAADELTEEVGGEITGADNGTAARVGDIVLVVVPWEGHAALLGSLAEELRGKLVVDCVNPLGFDKAGPYALPVLEGSAAEQARALLPESTVVAAFHHLSAVVLDDPDVDSIDADVLVLGDDDVAVDRVIDLAGMLPGVRGVFGGRLRNAQQVEALTANLIAINRRYRVHAGIRVTDV